MIDGPRILAALPEGVKLQEQDVTPEAHVLDSLSMSNVAHNLHYRFDQGGLDPAGAVSYAKRLLKLLGYPQDEITTQAAIESWQQLYPRDLLLQDSINPGKLEKTPNGGTTQMLPNVHILDHGRVIGTLSLHNGHVIDDGSIAAQNAIEMNHEGLQRHHGQALLDSIVTKLDKATLVHAVHCDKPHHRHAAAQPLYHWTEAKDLEQWMDPSHTGPGETYLTENGEDPATKWNDDIQQMQNPVRITIDPDHLDPKKFDDHYEGWLGNHLYKGVIPPEAILDIKAFRAPSSWNVLPDTIEPWEQRDSTDPSEVNNPEDHWSEFGQTPPDQHRDLQFSNDWH